MKHITIRHWAWIHFKVALALWAVEYLIFAPTVTTAALGSLRWVVFGATIVGAVISAGGLIISTQPGEWARKRGVQIELGGLIVLAIGPLVFWTTQLSFVIQRNVPEWTARIPFQGLAYVVLAAAIARGVTVVPRYRRELAEMVNRKDRA